MEISGTEPVWHTKVDQSGRVLLPVELREAMHAVPGTELVWTRTEDGIRLRNLDELIEHIQDYFVSLSPADELWSEELIQQRRDEAARE